MNKEAIIIISAYLLFINLTGAFVNIADKYKAKKNKWRGKENTLWLIAVLGGAPLSYITIKSIRHKTKHKSFMIGMPLLSVIQIALIIYLITKISGGI